MTGLLNGADVFFLCFFLTVGSQTVLPPENVTLRWIKGLYPELTWTPPSHSENCTYEVSQTFKNELSLTINDAQSPWSWKQSQMMDGGFMSISVQTVCKNNRSQPVVITNNDPELVMDLDCFIRSPNETRCSWRPSAHTPPDLSFFYELKEKSDTLFQECPSYQTTEGVRTGCILQVNTNQFMNALFKGTVNNTTVRNTYDRELLSVRAPPLEWSVKKTKEKFLINWSPPDFPSLNWKFVINYTSCHPTTKLEEIEGNSWTSAELTRLYQCPYHLRMRAVVEGNAETEWTSYQSFEADPELDTVLLVVVLVPLLMAVLALLILLYCMKNKDKIFPKVPQPRLIISDICYNNNNKINVPNLHFPKEEECCVTLVLDPSKPQL